MAIYGFSVSPRRGLGAGSWRNLKGGDNMRQIPLKAGCKSGPVWLTGSHNVKQLAYPVGPPWNAVTGETMQRRSHCKVDTVQVLNFLRCSPAAGNGTVVQGPKYKWPNHWIVRKQEWHYCHSLFRYAVMEGGQDGVVVGTQSSFHRSDLKVS